VTEREFSAKGELLARFPGRLIPNECLTPDSVHLIGGAAKHFETSKLCNLEPFSLRYPENEAQ
jgi:hypothetical protein